MATGGEPSGTFVEATGSEAAIDHVCSPCSDEQTKEAVGICVDCEDWLCEECLRVHKRSKLSKSHVLMNTEEMKNSTQGLKAADKCTERCDRHSCKRIKYFCKDHDFLGCSECVIEKHRTCKVQNIPKTSTDAATKTKLKQTTADLEVITNQSKELATELRKKIALVKQNKSETIVAFQKYKKELVESLDKIEITLVDICRKKEEGETERLKKILERCGELEHMSLQTKNQLKVFDDRGQYCNMYVAIVRESNKVRTMKDNIRKAQGLSSVTLYRFQPNLETGEILKSPKGMGALVADRSDTDYSKIQANHLLDISVESEGKSVCGIIGSALLPGHKLVLTDYDNTEVKVIDTNQNKMLSRTEIDGRPWGICRVSDSSVAVTVCHKNRLLFLSVDGGGKLATIKAIAVSGECYGVAATDDRIVVSYKSPDKIEILDVNGSIIKAFDADIQVYLTLASPQYISLSLDKKSVYVSNRSKNTVACISLDGKITALYRDSEMHYPEQIAVDSNGVVYVGCRSSNNVHLITPDCKKMKVLLNASHGLKQVHAVSYCDESHKLYVGMDNCDVIKVFQLT